MKSEEDVEYNLFNGRRSADQYVKGYLKGVLWISGGGLTLFMAVSAWVCLSIIELRKADVDLYGKYQSIVDTRFDRSMGNALQVQITENRLSNQIVQTKLDNILNDIKEFKDILRRTAPFERKEN